MIELKEKRDINKKEYRVGKNKREVLVSGQALHYKDAEGNWQDISLHKQDKGDYFLYDELPYFLSVPKTPDGKAEIKARDDSYSLSVGILPEKKKCKLKGKAKAGSEISKYISAEKIVVKKALKNAEIDWLVNEDGMLKYEYVIPSLDDVPDKVTLNIDISGITVEKVGKYTVEDIVDSYFDAEKEEFVDTKEVTEYPTELVFKANGKTVWRMSEPFWIDAAGHEYTVPIRITSESDSNLQVDLEVAYNWMAYGIESEYEISWPVKLDPCFTSAELDITNNGNTSHNVDSGEAIDWAQCRWRGKSQFTSGSFTQWASSSGQSPNGSTTLPSAQGVFKLHSAFTTISVGGGVSEDTQSSASLSGGGMSASASMLMTPGMTSGATATAINHTSYMPGATVSHSGSPGTGSRHSRTFWVTSSSSETKTGACSVAVGGQTTTGPNSLNNNTWSGWYPMGGVSIGDNTFTHSIGGSNQAVWQFKYAVTEIPYPTPIAHVYVQGDNLLKLPVVDVNDVALEYDKVRVGLDGGIGAADIVETDDETASNVRIQTADGIKAWRLCQE